jgi:hypothetical protein
MTDSPLQDRLRRVLTADAERAPAAALTPERFRHTLAGSPAGRRSRPGRRPGFPTVRTAVAAAAVLIAAAVAVVALAGRNSSPAFASWVGRPNPISAADTARLGSVCGGRHPLIVDRRGHSAYAVYNDGPDWTDCLATVPGLPADKGLPKAWLSHGSLTAVAVAEPDTAHPAVVVSVKAPEGDLGDRAPVAWVSGRITPAVTRITIQTADGTVIPTIHDGTFAAWWPGNDNDQTVIRGYDNTGGLLTTIDQLNCGGPKIAPRIQTPGQPTTGGCSR